MQETERILGPAIKHDGVVHKLPEPNRHFHILHKMARRNGALIISTIAAGQQGFYTNLREFITRKEGKIVARKSGQNKRDTGPSHTLFTEDMW
jgi:hypothetical protein